MQTPLTFVDEKKRIVDTLISKSTMWKDLANHMKKEGRQQEASEYYVRSRTFSEAAYIVEFS